MLTYNLMSNNNIEKGYIVLIDNFYTSFKSLKIKLSEADLEQISQECNIETIKTKLVKLIGRDHIAYVADNYQAGQVTINLYAAYEMHTEGQAYRNKIAGMYYLNEDFNDKYYHFYIALERYRLNHGIIRSKILEIKRNYGYSKINDYENYLITKQD